MTTLMLRRVAHDMIAERHAAAERTRTRVHRIPVSPPSGRATVRLTGPVGVVIALAMLLVSIPMLAAVPTSALVAPMPSPTPGAVPSVEP